MSSMTRERLKARVREVLPGTSMPAWKGVLAESEIDAIAAYIGRTFHALADGPSASRP
jgi:cytochrome c oxidase cbb3-type subunit 3